MEYTVLAVSESLDLCAGRTDLTQLLPLDLRNVQWVDSQAEASLVLLNRTSQPIPDFLVIETNHDGKCGVDPLLVKTLARLAPEAHFKRKRVSEEKVLLLGALSERAQAVKAEGLANMPRQCPCQGSRDLPSANCRCLLDQAAQPIRHDLGSGHVFLAASQAMKQLYQKVLTLAEVEVPILLLGESGTGKEVIARLIHASSPRKHRPMMRINCAALPADLLESELFGYEAGAFTGAVKAKPGKFELCDGGTLFLDEIGEMSAALQAKLLHVLQDGEYSRLGGRTARHANVRIIAATNIDMEKSIQERTFREDLYYRLSAFVLNLPPLRERKEELGMLIDHFRQSFALQLHMPAFDFDEEILAAAYAYHWPGNMRELMNFIQRTTVFRDREVALSELQTATSHRPKPVTAPAPSEPAEELADMKSSTYQARMQVEKDLIVKTLNSTGWNRKHAADRLKVSYKTLLCKIREYKIEEVRMLA